MPINQLLIASPTCPESNPVFLLTDCVRTGALGISLAADDRHACVNKLFNLVTVTFTDSVVFTSPLGLMIIVKPLGLVPFIPWYATLHREEKSLAGYVPSYLIFLLAA